MLTNDQIEQQLKATADMCEKGLKDINNGKATKTELLKEIEDRTKVDKEMLAAHKLSIDDINTGLIEAKAAIEESQKQLRNFKNVRNSSFVEGGRYPGVFSSPQEAKAFTLLVLAGTMANMPKMQNRFDTICKSLDAMGIEPYWIDFNGRKTMVGPSQTGGGALVTVEQVPTVIRLLETYGKFHANAQKQPMGAGQTLVPKTDKLLTGYCPGEGGTITETEPEINLLGLTPKTICYLTGFSLELEEDSYVALGELIIDLMARSMAYDEDRCGFIGDGTSTYYAFKGITSALLAVSATIANIKSLIVGAGNAYSELTLANFESVAGILPENADVGDVKWYVHRYFFFTVMVTLALAAGSGTATEIITGQALRQRTYLGYPVEFTQVMPKAAANSQICALLANLKLGAILGTRGGMEFAQSSERYFEKGIIAIRGRNRFTVNAHGVGDTTNAGPICGLITAAS